MPSFSQLGTALAGMTRDAESTSIRKLFDTCEQQPKCPLFPDAWLRFEELLLALSSPGGIAPLTNAGEPFRLNAGLLLGFLQSLLIPGGSKGVLARALKYVSLLHAADTRLEMAAAILDQMCSINHPMSKVPVTTWRTYGVCVSSQIPSADTGARLLCSTS